MTRPERNLRYTTVPIIFAVLLIILGIFGVCYFIVFIRSNSVAYQITSFTLAALGVHSLYNRMGRRKQINDENK
jgi:hypothetical protein